MTQLNRRQIVGLVSCGIVLWAFAALLLRVLGPMGIYEGGGRVILYFAVIPGTVPFVWLVVQLTKLAPGQWGAAYGLATAIALLLDGVAVAWSPVLYGDGETLVRGASAVILWGAGVGILLAFLLDPRRRNFSESEL